MECIECPYYNYGLGGQYCEKVGGKTSWYGFCEDTFQDIQKHINRSKQKRKNKRERDQKYKNHLKFLNKHSPCYHPSSVIYIDEICVKGQWIEIPKPYFKRHYRGRWKGMSYYHKKMSNKAIRRYKGDIPKNGNWCHKLYDFWWEMY